MKFYIFALLLTIFTMFSCDDTKEISEFTGNETTYSLLQGSQFPISGIVTIKEKTDGSSVVIVELTGTEGTSQFPVHLHMGDISQPDAELAALLNPVFAASGESTTHLVLLKNESPISYRELVAFEGSIKVHLAAAGPERNVVLAGANIGAFASRVSSSSRASMAVCKSE